MKKFSTAILIGLMMIASVSFAETVPDPTVDVISPPAGLPQTVMNPSAAMNIVSESQSLNFQGVLVLDQNKKESKNKVFFNNVSYSVGDTINDTWKVKSINKSKVILVENDTQKTKTFNALGE